MAFYQRPAALRSVQVYDFAGASNGFEDASADGQPLLASLQLSAEQLTFGQLCGKHCSLSKVHVLALGNSSLGQAPQYRAGRLEQQLTQEKGGSWRAVVLQEFEFEFQQGFTIPQDVWEQLVTGMHSAVATKRSSCPDTCGTGRDWQALFWSPNVCRRDSRPREGA